MKLNNTYPVLRTIRRIVQIGVLFFFFFLLVKTAYPLQLKKWVDFFPRLSPTGVFLTIISSRMAISGILPAILLLVLTLLLGRFFCGWLCPLGTTIDFSDTLLRKNRRERKESQLNLRALKYYFLLFLFITALFGLQTIGWVDPLSLVTRSYALLIYPYLNFLGAGLFNLLYQVPGVNALSEPLYSFLKTYFFTPFQYLYQGHPFFLLVLVSILIMGLFSRRWWCRNLCPLGALLALVSRCSFLKRLVKSECLDCDACLKACKMGAIGEDGKKVWRGECIECLNCAGQCPQAEVSFQFFPPKRNYRSAPLDLSRRGFLLGTLSAVAAFPLFSLNYPRRKKYPYLVRPPGSIPEENFTGKCIRCGLCMAVCPTNGLHPGLWQAGGDSLWTPILVSRVGYCEYSCNLCTQVCPTDAIREISLERKKKWVIGTAYIDENRCIPYSRDKNCLVCEEVCPIPTKAIKFRKDKAKNTPGKKLLYPYVLEERCIGCGICENKCPVEGKAAIIVTVPQLSPPGYADRIPV
ncbi:MAG: 4Fe-4S dicluster domain-containing protein [Nitrospirae bacterium]|nr:4Fe-4S dicluster domain-containing protein [Nitrospirota bacterium]